MRTKKLFAGVLAGAMVVGCMAMSATAADTYAVSGSTEVSMTSNDSWWAQEDFALTTLFPEVEYVEDVASVTISWEIGGYCTVAYVTNTDGYKQLAGLENPYSLNVSILTDLTDDNQYLTIADSFTPLETETVTVDYTYTAYDDTVYYELSDEELAADSYTVTLTSTSGRTCELDGDTYVVYEGKKCIAVDVSEIPESETITISVEFN